MIIMMIWSYLDPERQPIDPAVSPFVDQSAGTRYSPNSTWLFTSRLGTARHTRRDERVEPCCSTKSSTRPKCMGSTRLTCRVQTCRYEPSGIWAYISSASRFLLSGQFRHQLKTGARCHACLGREIVRVIHFWAEPNWIVVMRIKITKNRTYGIVTFAFCLLFLEFEIFTTDGV